MNAKRGWDPLLLDGIIRFFLCAVIFWTPYSPAAVESCVGFALFFWIFKRVCQADWRGQKFLFKGRSLLVYFRPVPSPLDIPVGLLLVVCLISILGSSLPLQSWRGFFTKTLEWFVVFFLFLEVFTEKRHLRWAVNVLLFTALATAADALIQFYVTGKDIFLGNTLSRGGARAAFHHANALGGYLSALVPLTTAFLFLKDKRRWLILAPVVLCLVAVWALFVTLSRGAWVAALIGAMVVLVLLLHKKAGAALLSLFVIAAIGVVMISPSQRERVRLSWENISSTGSWRLGLWQDSFKMIAARPLFGHGLNTYMKKFQDYRRKVDGHAQYDPTYAHNCYVQLAAETGILGLGAFLWAMGAAFRSAYFTFRNAAVSSCERILLSGLIGAVAGFLLHSGVDINFYSLQLSVFFWSLLGLLIAWDKVLRRQSVCDITQTQILKT